MAIFSNVIQALILFRFKDSNISKELPLGKHSSVLSRLVFGRWFFPPDCVLFLFKFLSFWSRTDISSHRPTALRRIIALISALTPFWGLRCDGQFSWIRAHLWRRWAPWTWQRIVNIVTLAKGIAQTCLADASKKLLKILTWSVTEWLNNNHKNLMLFCYLKT